MVSDQSSIPVFDLVGRDPFVVAGAVIRGQAVINQVVPKVVAEARARGWFKQPDPGCFWVCVIRMTPNGDEYDAILTMMSREQLLQNSSIKISGIEEYCAKRQAVLAYYRDGEFYMGQMADVAFLPSTVPDEKTPHAI